ncbi:MAG: hypothetical protein Q4C53_03665 [Clostridia bacterium]|nr:hypothetical protein [Clostridia bacterium]
MPPKPKFTEEEIVSCALEIVRESGIDALAARTVAKRLGTTTTPIFTFFSGMDELKEAVCDRVRKMFIAELKESLGYEPAFKAFGMRFIRFAKHEPNLYRIVNTEGIDIVHPERFRAEFREIFDPMCGEIGRTFGLSEHDAMNLMNRMLVFANGIAAFESIGATDLSDEELGPVLSEVCLSMVLMYKTRDGSITPQIANALTNNRDRLPVPKRRPAEGNE